MLLTIYDSKGNKRADIAAEDSSTQQKEVQGDNILTLSFKHYMHIPLDVNDYTDYEGERYWLTEKYTPAQKSEGEWEYDLKLYGIESLIRRFLVLETTDGDTNPLFTLTATPREHVAMIVKCINDGMGHITDWKVGQVDGTELIVIDYEGKYCNEALKEIAEKTGGGAEWWMEGQTVNVCRCEHGEEITLGYGKGLTSLERDTGNTDKFYTRLFPVGSTRNIDPEKYGSPRLMLPGKKRYIEVGVDEYGIYDHYEEKAFSGIYPRRTGTVSSVRKEDVKDDDGNPFTIYYFSDSSLNFDPNSYELPEETKRVSFQDGDLSGLGQGDDHYFEVNYNSKTREFEITTIWPYDDDTQLPGDNLIPKEGDHYILWNIRMPDEYYPMAEEEFQKAVDEYNKEHWRDISVYKAPTDHVWMEENKVDLYIGRRVRLESDQLFPETGYRQSRITKMSRRVNLPGQIDIEISDVLWHGGMNRIDNRIGELKNFIKAKSDNMALPDIIRTGDSTVPTDNNLFSAKRIVKNFLSSVEADSAKELITFQKGAIFGEKGFVPGLTGYGGQILEDGSGELESLIIRRFLEVPDINFNRVRIKVGDEWNAPGGGLIERVVIDMNEDGTPSASGTAFLRLEDGEIGAVDVDDICMGIFHSFTSSDNATADSDDSRGNRQFAGFFTCYFRVTSITDYTDEEGKVHPNGQFSYQLRPMSDRWIHAFHPCASMSFVGYGNFTKADRQTSSYQTRTYHRYLRNQNTWEIGVNNLAAQFGDLQNMSVHGMDIAGYSIYLNSVYFTGTIKQMNPDGTEKLTANDRGQWVSGTVYAYYDRVSWNGSLWLCVSENGTNTEPSDSDPNWLLQVAAGATLQSMGHWTTDKTPYPINAMVMFAGMLWVSNKETSQAPYPIYTDETGNRYRYKDGAYVLASTELTGDWDLLLDSSQLMPGEDGKGLEVQYSSNGTSWHANYTAGDVYMRQRLGADGTWTPALRIVGEKGAAGTNGSYVDFEFAVNTSATVAPTTGWQDAPPSVAEDQYLWMRHRTVQGDGSASAWSVNRIKGDRGYSMSNQGRWYSGLHVPYLGIVSMGGAVWQCTQKNGTTNPPLGCYTTASGSRLRYKSGGYVLNGQVNTAEYELLVQNGQDGQDGKPGADGKPGTDGKQGIQGMIIRRSEWRAGVEYHNDEQLTADVRYLDVVLVRNQGAALGWSAYRCVQTHVSSAANKPGNTGYWQAFGVEATAIFTSLIVADDAVIQFMQGNQLLIKGDGDTVEAGLSGSNAGQKVRIWAGSTTPDNAPFRVTADGKVVATDIDATGKITATGGKIGDYVIEGGSLSSESSQSSLVLNSDNIRFTNKETNMMVAMGAATLPSTVGFQAGVSISHIRENTSMPGMNLGMILDVAGQKVWDDDAMYGNHAMLIPRGTITGLRRKLRRVDASCTLSKYDAIVRIVGSAGITVSLPSGCEDGQEYWIHGNGKTSTVRAISATIDNKGTNVSSVSVTDRVAHIFIYDSFKNNWLYDHLSD